MQADAERAARLLGAGTRLLAGSGFPFDTPDRLDYEWMVAHTRRQLPDAAFAAAWARGQQWPLDQVIAYTVGDRDQADG